MCQRRARTAMPRAVIAGARRRQKALAHRVLLQELGHGAPDAIA